MPIARTVGNCLSMANYVRLAQALGAVAAEGHRSSPRAAIERRRGARDRLRQRDRRADEADDALLAELCALLAEHSATTLWVTKEALRRARVVPEGDDLIRLAYGSDGFRSNVRRFLA